jgi:hypothetical protein
VSTQGAQHAGRNSKLQWTSQGDRQPPINVSELFQPVILENDPPTVCQQSLDRIFQGHE